MLRAGQPFPSAEAGLPGERAAEPRMIDVTSRTGTVSRLTPAIAAAAGLLLLGTLPALAQDPIGSGAAPPAADFSFLGLFLQAHIVVKLVMIGLIVSSIWVWAIVINKWMLFSRNKREMDRFEQVFWSGQDRKSVV